MKRIINIYILKQILSTFFISLMVLVFVFFTTKLLKLTEMVINKGIPLSSTLKLVVFTMPYLFVFILPMATLLSVLITYSRLSSDNEIVALKACGISLYQMLPPVIMVTISSFLISSLMAIYAMPWGSTSFKTLLFNLARNRVEVGIKEQVFNDDFQGLVIYVNQISSKSKIMDGVFISDQRDPETSNTIVAKRGTMIPDKRNLTITFRMFDGSIHRVAKDLKSTQTISFEVYDLNLDLEAMLPQERRDSKGRKELSLGEIRQRIKRLGEKSREYNRLTMELHRRFSIPFACFVLGLMAVPLGVTTRASGRSWGAVLALAFFLIYYILLSSVWSLGEAGILPPALGTWIPNIVLGAMALYMLVKTANESPITVLSLLNGLFDIINRLLKKFY